MSAAVKADPAVIAAMADDGFVVGCCNPNARELTEIVEDYLSRTRPDRDQALEEAAGWQPIETAPKDGLIDIWIVRSDGSGLRWAECYYDRICGEWRTTSPSGHLLTINERHVSHWRPLPAPPPTGAS